MVTTAPTFLEHLRAHPKSRLEMIQRQVREKPEMAYVHNSVISYCHVLFVEQLDWSDYQIRVNIGHLSRATASYLIPDLMVIPQPVAERFEQSPHSVELYREPLPLVIEVLSPSTGGFDKTIKLEEYQARGDEEIWLLNADDESLRSVVRQPDGTYHERTYHAGDTVTPVALPEVSIDIGQLFRRGRPVR